MSLNASEQILHQNLLTLVKKEREILSKILEHLQQVSKRKLFAKMGYSSIYKYLIFELGYSEGAAYRRMSALKLVKEVPETKKLIQEGKINLTSASTLQNMLKDKDLQTKKSALDAISGQNSKEAQVTLLSFAGVAWILLASATLGVCKKNTLVLLKFSPKNFKRNRTMVKYARVSFEQRCQISVLLETGFSAYNKTQANVAKATSVTKSMNHQRMETS